MKKHLRTFLQYLFFLGVGLFFGWLSLRNLDSENREQIRRSLSQARLWLVVPVCGILILSHLVRALRWKLLIEPLGHTPSTRNTFFAVMIGYLVNQGVPRLGEVFKCTLLARYEKVPVDKLIGTVIVERLVDALTFVAVIGLTFAIQPGLYGDLMNSFFAPRHPREENGIPGYLFVVGLVLLLVLAALLWMWVQKKTLSDLFTILKRVIRSVWQGVSTVFRLRRKWLFLFYTVAIWSLYLLAGYVGFFAFVETAGFGLREALTILTAGSIGMIASPGGIGAYAYLVQQTMMVYGLGEAPALAFGWILWIVTTGVIVITGLISFAALPYIHKRRLREIA